MEVGRERGKI